MRHYDAYAYHKGETYDNASWFREIYPLTDMNPHLEITLALYSWGHQTNPHGPFYGVSLSTQSPNP